MEYEIVAEGDIRVDVSSFFEVFPDPLAKTWKELQYLIQAKVRNISYYPLQYPDKGNLLRGGRMASTPWHTKQGINAINTTSGTAGTSATQLKNSAIELAITKNQSKKIPYAAT